MKRNTQTWQIANILSRTKSAVCPPTFEINVFTVTYLEATTVFREPRNHEKDETRQHKCLYGSIRDVRNQRQHDPSFSQPALAAAVYILVRGHLWDRIQMAGVRRPILAGHCINSRNYAWRCSPTETSPNRHCPCYSNVAH